jgi:S1-C subfamily serine protease
VVVNPTHGPWAEAGIPAGFIVLYVDKVAVDDLSDLVRMMDYKKGAILVEGITPEGERRVFAVDLP